MTDVGQSVASGRTEEVLRSGRFDKLTVRQARTVIDSEYDLSRVPVTERFYFGCIGSPGHGFYGNHRHGATTLGRSGGYSEMCSKLGFEGVDGRLQPRGNTTQGEALLHHSSKGWTALSFWDYSVDTRGGCNSNFFADQRLNFDEMLADAKEHWPTIFERFDFEVLDVTHA